MKDDTIVTCLGGIIGLGVLGCIVAVGILSASFWVSLLAFVGLILTGVGISVANEKQFGGASVALLVAAGVTGDRHDCWRYGRAVAVVPFVAFDYFGICPGWIGGCAG